jgi:hypothetical protein
MSTAIVLAPVAPAPVVVVTPPIPAPVVVVIPATPTPVVVTGPPPSTLRAITTPKISRDDKSYYCEVGRFVFIRDGHIEETPKLTTQVFSLLLNGKVIETLKSYLDKVSFTKNESYLQSTLTCRVEVSQENLTATSHSVIASVSASHALVKKKALAAADAKYYKDLRLAYSNRSIELARISGVKVASQAVAKNAKDLLNVFTKYQKAFSAARTQWKQELAQAASNRVIAKALAQEVYLNSLEMAGISIYPISN